MGKSDLKITTKALICAAQEQAIRMNHVKYSIAKSADSPTCRLRKERGETGGHIISECKKLAQKDYKKRHENVAKIIHWKLCESLCLKVWVMVQTQPRNSLVNVYHKLLSDINIQCDHIIKQGCLMLSFLPFLGTRG